MEKRKTMGAKMRTTRKREDRERIKDHPRRGDKIKDHP
jgi:hypothetical protein